jgi:hypothetical protein
MNPETGVEVDDVFSPEKILESKGKELFTLRRVDGLEVHVKRLFEGVFEEHCDP